MANDLTGDFDVVAEFAIPAANRFLAAMHRIERFPHSMAIRVDDTPPRPDHIKPSIVEIVDTLGDAIVNPRRIRMPNLLPGQLVTTDAIYSPLDVVVNTDVVGATVGPVVPSHLQGRAQLQLSPPTVEIADGSGSRIGVRLQIMSRYFPDPNTSTVAEFVRGELQITAAVNQVASQLANVLDIDINTVNVTFIPTWSSRPLSAEDLAGINVLIRNALKTSFLPSNTTLPSNIRSLQLKTLAGAQNAIAVLLNVTGNAGNPATLHDVFLGSGDDFALAVGAEFMRAAFKPTVDQILSRPIPPVSFNISILFHTFNVTYTVSLNSAAVDLQTGKIVLTMRGHAHTATSWMPDFDFTVRQTFTLNVDGPKADLAVGDLSLDTSSWVVNRFKGGALARMASLRDQALAERGVQGAVRRMLSADESLGGVLRSLLTPARSKVVPQVQGFRLAYTAVDIRSAGIVLHGSLSVSDWPPAHVEFEQIPPNGDGAGFIGGGGSIPAGPEYSALKTWIPGGVIQGYEWKRLGQTQPGSIDNSKFVWEAPPPVLSDGVSPPAMTGYAPLCLTVRGSRQSASGPVVAEPVTASVCGYNSFPMIDGLRIATGQAVPFVSLARPGPSGLIEIVGHTHAGVDEAGRGAPNLIVHFADESSAGHLQLLTDALRDSRRADAATAVVAVLMPDHLKRARYTPGVVYTEPQEGAWERLFGVTPARRPATFVVGPKGNVAWQHEGALDATTLAAALRKALAPSRPAKISMLTSNVRISHPAPNFLFEYAPGRELTLRKLTGRPVILVFWKSISWPSIATVRELHDKCENTGDPVSIVLAINDGEPTDSVKKFVAEHRLSATLVTDPERTISRAYGVKAWPTVVFVDARGLVRAVHCGRVPYDPGESPLQHTPAAPAGKGAA